MDSNRDHIFAFWSISLVTPDWKADTAKVQVLQNKEVTENKHSDLPLNLHQDPDLAEIVRVWPDLPEHIKAAIKVLVETHKAETK